MIAEAGVHLSFDAELESVLAEGGSIRSITLRDGQKILRLESVWMITGQAAGVAAAMAAKQGVPVQALDVARVQGRLREAGQVIEFIPGQPEKCEELNGPPEF